MRNTRLFTACFCVALGWGAAGCEAPDSDAADAAAMRDAAETAVGSAEMPSLEELTGIIESFYRCALGREVAQRGNNRQDVFFASKNAVPELLDTSIVRQFVRLTKACATA